MPIMRYRLPAQVIADTATGSLRALVDPFSAIRDQHATRREHQHKPLRSVIGNHARDSLI